MSCVRCLPRDASDEIDRQFVATGYAFLIYRVSDIMLRTLYKLY